MLTCIQFDKSATCWQLLLLHQEAVSLLSVVLVNETSGRPLVSHLSLTAVC